MTARDAEREASARRERLASTLDELSASLTPGRMLDEVLSYAKGGGGNFLMGLGKSAAANPLPTLLISTGCAMYLSGKGGMDFVRAVRGRPDDTVPTSEFARSVRGRHNTNGSGLASKAAHALSDAASSVGGMVGSVASGVAASASNIGSRVGEAAKGTANAMADQATQAGGYVSSVGETAREYAEDASDKARDAATSAQRKATLMGRELQGKAASLFDEYPLVVAAGGVLMGAALAALLPRTRIEDQFMGESSDTLKGAFVEGASEKVERVATGVEKIYDRVAAKAGEEDILGTAKGSIDELTGKIGRTLQEGKDAVDQELAPARQQ
jgi:hypothetical protein